MGALAWRECGSRILCDSWTSQNIHAHIHYNLGRVPTLGAREQIEGKNSSSEATSEDDAGLTEFLHQIIDPVQGISPQSEPGANCLPWAMFL